MGPPWSKRENGFIISETHTQGIKLYYEPHCDYDEEAIARIGKVDAVVTPVNSQVLVTFPLVRSEGFCYVKTVLHTPADVGQRQKCSNWVRVYSCFAVEKCHVIKCPGCL